MAGTMTRRMPVPVWVAAHASRDCARSSPCDHVVAGSGGTVWV